jgi:thiol-disulfide isomerase/thioredoxin
MNNFMKKFLFLFLILSVNPSFAQVQTLFLDKNYDAVIKQSKLQKKPIVVMFYATWCEHCKKMKNEVFIDNDVINYYNSNFICMAIDSESKEGIDLKTRLQNKFRIKFYPTFSFLDSDENLLNSVSSELKKDGFINEGKISLTPETQFITLKNNFYSDINNPDNCLKYILALRKAGLDATKVAESYLNTKSEQELFSEVNWRIIANGINNIEATEITLINQHKEEFAKVSSPIRVEKKLVFVTADNLKPLVDLNDTTNYYRLKPIAAAFNIRKVDSLLFKYDLQICENTKNWKNYQETANKSVEKFAWKDSNTLIEIATFYLNYVDDKLAINNAINWSKQSLFLGESLNKYVLISKLYLKQKDIKNALDYAEKGKLTASNFGWKTDEIDNLISVIKK